MKKNYRIPVYLSIATVLIILFSYGCRKDDNSKITDKDGNVYTSVTIGTQEWMVENLKTTKYSDGSEIQNITDQAAWANSTVPAYSWYLNDPAANKNTYGALYNLYAVNSGKLCPTGWHVAKDTEWQTLVNYLGGETIAANALKESGISHWVDPNAGAINSEGFTALPGGSRLYDGSFYGMNRYGYWWTYSNATDNSGVECFSYEGGYVYGFYRFMKLGASVRCIKD